MPDKKIQPVDNRKDPQREETASPKPLREVVVPHLDEPPPSGKRKIHPRRPAPLVPDKSDGDNSSQK